MTRRNSNAFASSNDLTFQFDHVDDPDRVVIDLSEAHIWDASTVAALDAITTEYENRGTEVTVGNRLRGPTVMRRG